MLHEQRLISCDCRSIGAAEAAHSCEAHKLVHGGASDKENRSSELIAAGQLLAGDTTESIRSAQRAVHMNPSNAEAWSLMAAASLAKGVSHAKHCVVPHFDKECMSAMQTS